MNLAPVREASGGSAPERGRRPERTVVGAAPGAPGRHPIGRLTF